MENNHNKSTSDASCPFKVISHCLAMVLFGDRIRELQARKDELVEINMQSQSLLQEIARNNARERRELKEYLSKLPKK